MAERFVVANDDYAEVGRREGLTVDRRRVDNEGVQIQYLVDGVSVSLSPARTCRASLAAPTPGLHYFDPGDICGPTDNNPCYSSWVKVVEPAGGNLVCDAGDSGGPWFNGGVAYGIQQAGVAPPACPQATFMQHNFFGLMTLAVLTE